MYRDIIKINSDIKLTDRNGNEIKVITPEPEYQEQIFYNKTTDDESSTTIVNPMK